MADEQRKAEALDDDHIGEEYPPDEPLGVEDYGTTGAEQRIPEPLDERVLRDEPDVLPGEQPLVVPTVDEDEARLDTEKDLVAEAAVHDVDTPEDPSGETGDRTATAADRAPAPAEEAAMHLEPEAEAEAS